MKTIQSKQLREEAEKVRRPLEAWRKTRKVGARIPEPLWTAMTRLATIYGINPVSEILRIPYYALRDRVVAQKTSASAAPPKATFIEFKALAPAQALAGVLELEDRAGTRMTLRLDSSSGVDVLALVQAFGRRGP